MEAGEQVAVIGLLPLAHFFLGKVLRGFFIQRLGKGAALCRVVCQPHQIAGALLIIPDREDITVFACVDQLGHAADIACDGRAARADALENGIREGLGHRGQKVDIHRAEKWLDRRHPAAERHPIGHVKFLAQAAEHGFIFAVARNEQAQLRRLFQRAGKGTHGGRNVLDRSQARGDAAEHVALLDLSAVGVAQIGGAVKVARRAAKLHAVVDFDNALGVEPARDQRARHAVGHGLVKVQKAQRNCIGRAEGVLFERIAEIVELIIRVHGRQHRDMAAAAHHRAHQVGAAAVAVDDVGFKLVHQVAHRARGGERIAFLDHAHVDAALARLIRKRACAKGNQHHFIAHGKSGDGIHNLGLGAAHVAAAHHLHHSQNRVPPFLFTDTHSIPRCRQNCKARQRGPCTRKRDVNKR